MNDTPDAERTATLEPADEPSSGQVWSLVVVHHPDSQRLGAQLLIAAEQSIELGRGGPALGPEVLADEHLSRAHARFEVSATGQLQARDCESRNGTYLNGARIEVGRVCAGDVIGIGRILLVAERCHADHRREPDDELVGTSWAWSRCVAAVDRGARRSAPALLWGPTGVGKDLLARRMHTRSGATGEFVALRCGSFGDNAATMLMPAVASAQGGTLYLDGIEDAPQALQAALLELLEHGQLRDPDSGALVPLSLRIVASARADPQALAGVRKDFLHRLAQWTVAVPELRVRRSDIALLVRAFVRRYAGEGVAVHPELAFRLLRHSWPGNVRELEAVVERAVVERGDEATIEEFPELDDILSQIRAPAMISTMSRATRPRQAWVVAASGTWFVTADGEKHSLDRRKVLVSLLEALVKARRETPGARLTVADLLGAAWPDDRFVGTAGANRVYVALATLRKLGLRDIVVRTEGGYMIDPNAAVQIIDA